MVGHSRSPRHRGESTRDTLRQCHAALINGRTAAACQSRSPIPSVRARAEASRFATAARSWCGIPARRPGPGRTCGRRADKICGHPAAADRPIWPGARRQPPCQLAARLAFRRIAPPNLSSCLQSIPRHLVQPTQPHSARCDGASGTHLAAPNARWSTVRAPYARALPGTGEASTIRVWYPLRAPE